MQSPPLCSLCSLRQSSGLRPGASTASSHREAPLISEDPVADNTDVYAFVSPDRRDTVTIVANYIPLEEPAGGPNFHAFGEGVLYELKIDNTGDGAEDISYQFRFRTQTRNPDTFLYNTGPIETISDTDWNRPQFYSVTRVDGSKGKGTVLASNLPTPPVNIGPRSTPNYGSLMAAARSNLPGGGQVFAGQTDDRSSSISARSSTSQACVRSMASTTSSCRSKTASTASAASTRMRSRSRSRSPSSRRIGRFRPGRTIPMPCSASMRRRAGSVSRSARRTGRSRARAVSCRSRASRTR